MLSREQLHAEHGPMVHAIAHQLRRELGLRVDVRDLINDGLVGLFEAAERYDDSRGVSFGAFARHRVRGAMCDGVRRNGLLSRRAREAVRRNAAAYAALEAGLETEADVGTDRSSKALTFAELMAEVAASIIATAEAQHEGHADPEESLLTESTRLEVRAAVARLTDQQQRVVHALVNEEKRQDQVAAELDLSRVAVAKTYARALLALRQMLG